VVLAATDTVTTTVSTAVRVINGVHDDTADGGTDAFVPVTPGFAELDVLVLFVADDAKAGGAVFIDQTDFAARQADLGVAVVAAHQLSAVAGTADQLGAAPDFQFNGVNGAADGHVLERLAIANVVADFLAAAYLLTDLHALGGQDVVVGAVSFLMRAMRALRLGSYSMCSTVAVTPSARLKFTKR